MKPKYLTKTRKQRLKQAIENNNLNKESAKNYILACGFSESAADKFIIELKVPENQQKIDKSKITELSDSDFEAIFVQKVWPPGPLVDYLNKYGFDDELITNLFTNYMLQHPERILDIEKFIETGTTDKKNLSLSEINNTQDKLKENFLDILTGMPDEKTPNSINKSDLVYIYNLPGKVTAADIYKELKKLGYTEEYSKYLAGGFERGFKNAQKNLQEEKFSDMVKEPSQKPRKLLSLSKVRSSPYYQWSGESEDGFILVRKDEQFWYFGAGPVENILDLQAYNFTGNLEEFLKSFSIELPSDYVELD